MSISPKHYELFLKPNLDTFIFNGQAKLELEAETPVNEVVLHSFEIEYDKIEVDFGNGWQPVNGYSLDTENQKINVQLPENDTKNFSLKFTYKGEHNEKLAGFYRSKFMDNGEEKYAVVTQFQANDARRAFPCFDVPGIKATYDIQFLVEKDLFTVSNMPIKMEEEKDGKKLVSFQTTPKMSSYLVFFAVGEFNFIETSSRNRQFRLLAHGDKAEKNGHLSLGFGVEVVEFLEDFFDSPYPLPKLDQLATPSFGAGAMENWGAILYRENALLHYEGITSQSQINGILGVVSHEIVHQWFGNLVSPETWKYLWLNESFATYVGNFTVDQLRPERKTFEYFVQSTNLATRFRSTLGVMDWDSMITTSPIEIEGDGEISFTAKTVPILYTKGGSILRQIHSYLGTEGFRDGLRAYFKKHAYSSTKSNKLWESLEEITGKPVSKIMESFVLQKGLPLLTLNRKGTKIHLQQQRFTYLSHDDGSIWNVPITVRLFKDGNESGIKRFVLDKKEDSFDLGDFDSYKFNVDLTGFYRVQYPEGDYSMLGELISKKLLGSIDRVNIEDDLFSQLKAGLISLDSYLDFLSNFENDDSHMVFSNIATHLLDLHGLLEEGETKVDLEKRSIEFLDSIFEKIGYTPKDGEPMGISIIRGSLLNASVQLGSEKSKEFALSQFEILKQDKSISADLRTSILSIAARETNDFQWFLDSFNNPISESELQNAIIAMTNFTNKELLEKVKEMVFTEIPNRNRGIAIAGLSRNSKIQDDIWFWYLANLDSFEALNNFIYQNSIVSIISAGENHLEDMKKFFNELVIKKPRIADAVEVAMEQLAIKMHFKKILS